MSSADYTGLQKKIFFESAKDITIDSWYIDCAENDGVIHSFRLARFTEICAHPLYIQKCI